VLDSNEIRYRIEYPELKNNLELAQYIEKQPVENRQAEYTFLVSQMKFKVKSFGYLMKKYEKWKERHGQN